MTPRALLVGLFERTAMEAMFVRVRPAAQTEREPTAVLVVASLIVQPVLVIGFVLWLVTGRGPAGRVLRWSAGAPRQRAIR